MNLVEDPANVNNSPTREHKLALLRATKHFTTPEINRYLQLPVSYKSLQAVVNQAALVRLGTLQEQATSSLASTSFVEGRKQIGRDNIDSFGTSCNGQKAKSGIALGKDSVRCPTINHYPLAALCDLTNQSLDKPVPKRRKTVASLSRALLDTKCQDPRQPPVCRYESSVKENLLHHSNASLKQEQDQQVEEAESPAFVMTTVINPAATSSPLKRHADARSRLSTEHEHLVRRESMRGPFTQLARAEDALRCSKASQSSQCGSSSPRAAYYSSDDEIQDFDDEDAISERNDDSLFIEAPQINGTNSTIGGLYNSVGCSFANTHSMVVPSSESSAFGRVFDDLPFESTDPALPSHVSGSNGFVGPLEAASLDSRASVGSTDRTGPSNPLPAKSMAKPALTYASMITKALSDTECGALTLNEVYQYINHHWPFYQIGDSSSGWQNSIRHNLSLNPSFVKRDRPPGWDGKGSLWTLSGREKTPLVRPCQDAMKKPSSFSVKDASIKHNEDAEYPTSRNADSEAKRRPSDPPLTDQTKKKRPSKISTSMHLVVPTPMVRSKSDSSLIRRSSDVDRDLTPLTPELRDFPLLSEPLEYTSLLHGPLGIPNHARLRSPEATDGDERPRVGGNSLFDLESSDLPNLTTDEITSSSSPRERIASVRAHKFISGKWHLSPTRGTIRHLSRPSLQRASTIAAPPHTQIIDWEIWLDLDT